MKATFVLTSLFAVAALASPLEKREQKTVYEIVTKTVYQYANPGPQYTPHPTDNTPTPDATTTAAAVQSTDDSDQQVQPTTVSSSAAAQSTDSSTSGGSYADNVLNAHNNRRSRHGVTNLEWSDDMASIAQQIAASCVYAHNT